MFVCQFYAAPPPLPRPLLCLSPVTVCMRLHLICIKALAAHIAELLPTLHNRRRRQRKTASRKEWLGGESYTEGRGEGEVLEAGSESSEKCANLVTKLARYFNIFRFAAATATPTDSITHFSVPPLSPSLTLSLSFSAALSLAHCSRSWYKSQPVRNYDRCGSRRCLCLQLRLRLWLRLRRRFVRKFVKFRCDCSALIAQHVISEQQTLHARGRHC